jgi:hypothetical protein
MTGAGDSVPGSFSGVCAGVIRDFAAEKINSVDGTTPQEVFNNSRETNAGIPRLGIGAIIEEFIE